MSHFKKLPDRDPGQEKPSRRNDFNEEKPNLHKALIKLPMLTTKTQQSAQADQTIEQPTLTLAPRNVLTPSSQLDYKQSSIRFGHR